MRFAMLAVMAALLVACDAARATVSPTTTLVATSSPAVTAEPTPTAAPTIVPTAAPPTCPAEPSAAELAFQAGPETDMIPLDTEPLATPEAVDAATVAIVATVLGGVDHLASVTLDEGPSGGIAITDAAADFLPFATATTLPVKATIDGGTVALVLPDSPLAGQLRVSVSWQGPCGAGSGTGSIGLAVVKRAVAAGCPATSDELLGETATFDGLHAAAGTVDIPLILTGWSGRWIPGVGASDIPQFAGWDEDHPVTAPPEGPITISETVDDITLVGIQVSIYARADVLAFLKPDSTGELDTLLFIHRNANAKGRASIPAPLEPGSYVVEVVGSWLTPCLGLETYSPFSLEVR